MEIVLFSDLHGNLSALDAFQAYLEDHPADRVICLGDVAVNGPQPHEAMARMRRWGIPIVMGNTDDWVLDPTVRSYQDEDTRFRYEIERWSMEQLSTEDLAFVRTFQPQIELPLPGGRNLLCCHGAPGSYDTTISSLTPHEELARLIGGTEADVVACGHTHAPMLRQVGSKLVVNPGSLGRPIEYGPDGRGHVGLWADFARLEVDDKGLRVSFLRIEYNVGAYFEIVRRSKMPHIETFIAGYKQRASNLPNP